jgi:uncharacterized protein
METQLFFLNEAIDVEQIPTYETITLQPIEKKYTTVMHYTIAITFGVLLIALITLFAFNAQWWRPLPISIVAIAYIVLLMLSFFWCYKQLQFKSYAIRTKDILYKTGWLFQKTHVIPYNKIQHCSVSSGPIERKYHLATLHLFTAANDRNDIAISGLTLQKAEQLKNWLMQNNTTDEQL